MKRISKSLALLSTLFMTACTAASFAVANLPTNFGDLNVRKNIEFGPLPEQKLDIYLPPASGASKDPRPVIVFFYGGRWELGSKSDYRFVGAAFAKQNYIVVIPDYRKYPDVNFPVFVDDAARAIAWTADHIKEYGGSPNQIYVMGHSSGAHIAALAIADREFLARFHKSNTIVKGFAGLAGPYDFVPDEPDLKEMFGPPERYGLMQVPNYIDGKEPPMLLLWGADDRLVGKQNMDKLASAIKKNGGCVKTKIYPGLDHVWIVGTLSWLGSSGALLTNDIVNFFQKPECDGP